MEHKGARSTFSETQRCRLVGGSRRNGLGRVVGREKSESGALVKHRILIILHA